MTKPSLIAAGVVVLALSELVRGADEARFYPPTSWSVSKKLDGTATVTPPDVPVGKTCSLMIMPDVRGEVNGVFAMSWRMLTENLKVRSGGAPLARRSKAEFETRSTTATVDAGDNKPAYMHLFAVQSGDVVRRALFVSDDKASFDKHLPTMKAMFENVGIDPAKIKQVATTSPTTEPGFEGVFYRGNIVFNASGAPGERTARIDYLCFAPDGRAYNGYPSGGPAACFEIEESRSPSYGRYTLSGDEIVIKWNKQQDAQTLKRRADGKLEQDGATFHPLPSCDDLKLDGTYTITWADHSKTRVRFTKDGHFKATGLQDCLNLEQLLYPDWPKLPASGAGTYSIKNNTLEVKYDNNGPTRRMFFTTPDDSANPKRISIANNPLEREP